MTSLFSGVIGSLTGVLIGTGLARHEPSRWVPAALILASFCAYTYFVRR